MTTVLERRLRTVLTTWQFWMILAYFFLAWTLAWVVFVYARQLHDEAIRDAERQATSHAAVARCIASRPQLKQISRFIRGENELALALVENSAAVFAATARTDPQYKVRRRNLVRIVRARDKVRALKALDVPSLSDCHAQGG